MNLHPVCAGTAAPWAGYLVGRVGAVLQGRKWRASGLKDAVVCLVDKGLLHRWSGWSLIRNNCIGY